MSEIELKNWEDLNYDERAEVYDIFVDAESDKNMEDYYKDNTEKFGFKKIVLEGYLATDCDGNGFFFQWLVLDDTTLFKLLEDDFAGENVRITVETIKQKRMFVGLKGVRE